VILGGLGIGGATLLPLWPMVDLAGSFESFQAALGGK
jgi:hypothetical protein